MVPRMHMNLEFIVYLRNERWNQRNQDGKTAPSAVKGGVCTSAPVAAATRNLYTGAAMPYHTHSHTCSITRPHFTYPHSHSTQDAYVAFVSLSCISPQRALTPGCSFVPEISHNTTAHSPCIWIAPRISGGHNNRHTAPTFLLLNRGIISREFPRVSGNNSLRERRGTVSDPSSSFATCAVYFRLV